MILMHESNICVVLISTIFFNYSLINSVVKESKSLIETCKEMNYTTLCLQNTTFYDSSCKTKYLALLPIKLDEPLRMAFCVPIKSPLLHGIEFKLRFALQLKSIQPLPIISPQDTNLQITQS